MIGQVLILFMVYLAGLLFILLFYPQVNAYIAASTALFWGVLINTLFGIFLGLFGWYSWVIWVMYIIFDLAMLIHHFRRKAIWQQAGRRSIIASQLVMAAAFSFTLLATGGRHQWVTSSASLPYVIYGSHIHHYGSILLPGAGYFFRSHYGISEALIHALGGFIDTPAMTLWHPFLYASQFAFLTAAFFDWTADLRVKPLAKVAIGMMVVLWSATASMNWFNSFYVHINLMAAISILIFSYFFQKFIHADSQMTGYGILGSLALCVFGLSRVESPVVILAVLGLLATQKIFSRREIRWVFIPPVILNLGWLTFLYFGYRKAETQYWSDTRLLIALGMYGLALVMIWVWQRLRFSFRSETISRLITFGILIIPLVLAAINPQKLAINFYAMMTSMFGTFQQPGGGVWNFQFWAAGFALVSILAISRPWLKPAFISKNYTFGVQFMLSYWMIILVLGFIRQVAYDGSRWGDSASRMITHLAPLMALLIGIWLVEIIGKHDSRKKISKPDNQ